MVYPSLPQNMGQMGMTFPMMSAGPIASGQSLGASPSQTVDGKGFSNPLMGVAFPKSKGQTSTSLTQEEKLKKEVEELNAREKALKERLEKEKVKGKMKRVKSTGSMEQVDQRISYFEEKFKEFMASLAAKTSAQEKQIKVMHAPFQDAQGPLRPYEGLDDPHNVRDRGPTAVHCRGPVRPRGALRRYDSALGK